MLYLYTFQSKIVEYYKFLALNISDYIDTKMTFNYIQLQEGFFSPKKKKNETKFKKENINVLKLKKKDRCFDIPVILPYDLVMECILSLDKLQFMECVMKFDGFMMCLYMY